MAAASSNRAHAGQISQGKRPDPSAAGEKGELSAAYLSQIEHEKASPSISTLRSLASALGVRLVDFFEDELINDPVVMTPDQWSRVLIPGWQSDTRRLVHHIGTKRMEPFFTTIPPGGKNKQAYAHPGEEFGFVIEGVLTVIIGEETHEAGRCALFTFPRRCPIHGSTREKSRCGSSGWSARRAGDPETPPAALLKRWRFGIGTRRRRCRHGRPQFFVFYVRPRCETAAGAGFGVAGRPTASSSTRIRRCSRPGRRRDPGGHRRPHRALSNSGHGAAARAGAEALHAGRPAAGPRYWNCRAPTGLFMLGQTRAATAGSSRIPRTIAKRPPPT